MRRVVSYRIKWLLAHGLYLVGALHLLKRIILRRRAVVLMYHRVLPKEMHHETWSHPGTIVTPETFDRQMAFVRRHFRLLSAAEFEARLQAGEGFEDASCLVTFDDGWIDTYTHAFPILRRHSVPALVFLPSAYIETGNMFWQEHLCAILFRLWRGTRRDPQLAASARKQLETFELGVVLDLSELEVREQILEVVRRRKDADLADPFAPIRVLSNSGNAEPPAAADRFMDWDQVLEMHREGVAFGAHGDTHRQLTALTREEIRAEFATSKAALEAHLRDRATCVSYPNGDWSELVLDEAKGASFVAGFTTAAGLITSKDRQLALKRVNIHEDTTRSLPMFLAKIIGVLP